MYELNSIRYYSSEKELNNKYGIPDSEEQNNKLLEHYYAILEIANYNLFAVLRDYLFNRNNMTKEQIKIRKDVVKDIKTKIKLLEKKRYI